MAGGSSPMGLTAQVEPADTRRWLGVLRMHRRFSLGSVLMLALIGYFSAHLLAHVDHQLSGVVPLEAVLTADTGTADVSSEADSDESDHGSAFELFTIQETVDSRASFLTIAFPSSVDLPPRLRACTT
jgi:hypothetical protein